MRVLVYPHELAIGGSQINAIDLAAHVASAGHEVFVYGRPGPLVPYIEKLGLSFIQAHPSQYRPSFNRVRELLAIARTEKLDLIHGYEWPTCLDAFFGAGLTNKTPVVCTVLSMQVQPFVPRSVPLVMGTAKLGDEAKEQGYSKVWIMEPPIDTVNDNPSIDGTQFRESVRVSKTETMIALVSRLAVDLKLDALVQAIDAAEILSLNHPVKLVIVGDGPARASLEERAKRVNGSRGREVVHFAGAMLDPRPAYAAADVVLGMGSSSMRAMAMGKPVVVQGERGFSKTFSPQNAEYFYYEGFYGLGDGTIGAARLAKQLEAIITDPKERALLGSFGQKIVTEKFSLSVAGDAVLRIYDQVLKNRPKYAASDACRSAWLAFMEEFNNHNPWRKRAFGNKEQALLEAARSASDTNSTALMSQ
ncbi:MAG: glycosyltransferase family 4 protein [Rhizobiaceae bacterium]|nr:glycosyltransferase family 4 protein [Rhizobiaceae bacterium]